MKTKPALTVLVTGASGLMGRAVVARLLALGYSVRGLCRRPPVKPPANSHLNDSRVNAVDNVANLTWIAADFGRITSNDWQGYLSGVDMVINAVGIFQESANQRFDSLHVDAPITLFKACVVAGVQRVVQLSALGASLEASTPYARSKAQADVALLALPLQGVVVRPSLVYADDGASSKVFRAMAVAPVLVVPADAGAVQPMHLDDLVDLLVQLVNTPDEVPHEASQVPSRVIQAVGPTPLPWADYLQVLRTGMGLAPAPVCRVPATVMRALVACAAPLRNGLLSRDSLALLRAGSCATQPSEGDVDNGAENRTDNVTAATLLQRPVREPATFTHPYLTSAAQWALSRPLLVGSLACVWLWTAWVSLAYSAAGLALMEDMGLPSVWHTSALYLGAGCDAAFGVLSLVRPSRRLWWAQFALVVGYTALITAALSSWWLHPFGPISKNLPILALLITLALHESNPNPNPNPNPNA